MVQIFHPWGVIWGPYFPPPVDIFSKKNQLSVLSIYIVVLAQPQKAAPLGPDNSHKLLYVLRIPQLDTEVMRWNNRPVITYFEFEKYSFKQIIEIFLVKFN